MTATTTSIPLTDMPLAAGLLLGLSLATALIALTDGLKPGRRRLLPVAGLATALCIALGAAHTPGGLAAMGMLSLLPGGALLLLRGPLRLPDVLPRLDCWLLPLAGMSWLTVALGVVLAERFPAAIGWAQALYLPALPPVALAAWRTAGRGDAGAGWSLTAAAGFAASAIAPALGADNFGITAAAMAVAVLGLLQSSRASLDAADAQRQSAEAHAQLARQDARLRDEHAHFFSFIAHELRSPLGVLLVGLSNLKRSMPDAESAARIGRVSNAAQRMSALIDRHACLLSLVRSDFEPAHSEHAPEQPALEALHALQDANPDRHFIHTCAEHARKPLSIDTELITLALSNLLENAVKHADADSPIRLEIDADAEAIHYRIINHGSPLPPELTDPAYPILLPMKGPGGARGSFGIGLALAARVARVHGGQLAGASADGQTTFTLTLPFRPPLAARTQE